MFLYYIWIFRFMYSFTWVDNRFVYFNLLFWTDINYNIVIFLNRQKTKKSSKRSFRRRLLSIHQT